MTISATSRIPALDGLRGLAIILVVISHLKHTPMFGGGMVGVTLFFVLSGYLITRILTRQADNGGIRFLSFYKRRARRLLPALVVVVAASWLLLDHTYWWSYAWPALTYTTNYTLLLQKVGTPLSHTWSLAVEEHFYLLWPILIAVIPARWRIRGVGFLAGTAMLWRGFLYVTEGWDRAYLATDGNAAALLIGCFLAVAASRLPTPNKRYGAYAVGALILLSVLPEVPLREPLSFLAIVLAALAVHHAPAFTPLETRWLGWFGTISYGLYLWHPIMFNLSHSWWMAAVSVAVAWLSWKLIEQPILNRRNPPVPKDRGDLVVVPVTKSGVSPQPGKSVDVKPSPTKAA